MELEWTGVIWRKIYLYHDPLFFYRKRTVLAFVATDFQITWLSSEGYLDLQQLGPYKINTWLVDFAPTKTGQMVEDDLIPQLLYSASDILPWFVPNSLFCCQTVSLIKKKLNFTNRPGNMVIGGILSPGDKFMVTSYETKT